MIRVSVVRNRRSTFLLSLSSSFVCDTPLLVAVSPVHSEVSGVVRVVRRVVRLLPNLADRSDHHVEFSDFHRDSRVAVVSDLTTGNPASCFAQHVVESGLSLVLFMGNAVIVVTLSPLVQGTWIVFCR